MAERAMQPRQRTMGGHAARFVLYAVLAVLALVFLMPVYVMVVNSLKPLEEIRSGNLMALPLDWTFAPWHAAWSTAQIGVQPTGLKPYFINSFLLVVPGVVLSTLIGAVNGYILTQFKVRGGHLLFAAMLFSVFIPFQIVLIPMAKTLGLLGIAGTVTGLVFVNTVYGIGFTTLFFRNYYAAFPQELVRSARMDGAGLLRCALAHPAAQQRADHRGDGDLAVHQHLERISLRGFVQRLQLVPDHRGVEQPRQQLHGGQGIQRALRGCFHRRTSNAGRVSGFRQVFRARPHGRLCQRLGEWLLWIWWVSARVSVRCTSCTTSPSRCRTVNFWCSSAPRAAARAR
jgi:ABC-type glycerol-3-phosphate transport system permease component